MLRFRFLLAVNVKYQSSFSVVAHEQSCPVLWLIFPGFKNRMALRKALKAPLQRIAFDPPQNDRLPPPGYQFSCHVVETSYSLLQHIQHVSIVFNLFLIRNAEGRFSFHIQNAFFFLRLRQNFHIPYFVNVIIFLFNFSFLSFFLQQLFIMWSFPTKLTVSHNCF